MDKATRKCYDCGNYFESYFCGYNSHECRVYGSLDMDQNERHPDTAAENCKNYIERRTGPNRCVMCGEVIPEGLQVCYRCTVKVKNADRRPAEPKSKEKKKHRGLKFLRKKKGGKDNGNI